MTRPPPGLPASPAAAFYQLIKRQPKSLLITAGLALVAAMALLDYGLSRRGIAWPIYYAIPILGLAWFAGWRPSLAAAIASALLNLAVDLALARDLPDPTGIHIGSAAFFVVVLLLAWLLAKIQMVVDFTRRGETWKAIIKPHRIGGRFIVVPEWLRDSYQQDIAVRPTDIPILMDMGQAFGTGNHDTTQMCAAMLETYLRPGARVFDLGCGTGILSLVAAKLGAASVLAVDIDAEAVRVTMENARLNEAAEVVGARQGSLELALSSSAPAQQFDVAVANLLADIIVDFLKQGLARVLAPDGTLILSGIRVEKADQIAAALGQARLDIVERQQLDEWVAFAVKGSPNR